ncbi:Putative peptidoglycan-binding domain-containing protein [Rhodovulum sp. P5]|uniref:peptidoglycan-binding domain-containing protein n=1 Tax=Rhodovulum sp. P5 TaxID=1564506 RepID=UPI0009C39FB4|nr:peptidoglycan-binding domain-containing protein [Rhodovulum sp. P5]ARE39287.1 Putative peptidoglycan-binding domain-containing protein [Rhodovulum sp. P5]
MKRQFAMACLAASLTITSAGRVAADAGDVAVGILGGIIGGAIVNEAHKKKTTQRRTTVSSATRAQNRETQTSLNYFGFPAGTVDGVMGQRSRNAISQYQAFMGYPVTGRLSPYERDFLVSSYHRAVAGGAASAQMAAASGYGMRGLLKTYQQQLATGGVAPIQPQIQPPSTTTVVIAPPAAAVPQTQTVVAPRAASVATGAAVGAVAATAATAAKPALPNFMGQGTGQSLASHCNKVSLLTNTNGGFTTAASMSDANFALNEQFCLARTYAIASGEELADKVGAMSSEQIADQCKAFGPVLKDYVAAVSLKPTADVMKDVGSFVLQTGMSPAQLAGTAKICLSVGYRTDDMDVAIGSALILVVLGEEVYAELLGHHLSQGFGASKRTDLAMNWYDIGFGAVDRGAIPVFAPGQPERSDLIRKAAYQVGGRSSSMSGAGANDPQPAALPTFSIDN